MSSTQPQEPQVEVDPLIKFFQFEHLPEKLKVISSVFWDAAHKICAMTHPSAERTVALRKLLESKDAAVRSAL